MRNSKRGGMLSWRSRCLHAQTEADELLVCPAISPIPRRLRLSGVGSGRDINCECFRFSSTTTSTLLFPFSSPSFPFVPLRLLLFGNAVTCSASHYGSAGFCCKSCTAPEQPHAPKIDNGRHQEASRQSSRAADCYWAR